LSACSGDDDDTPAVPTTTPDQTTPLVTTPNGEPVQEGDFVEVANGDDDGLEWTLYRAPAAAGGTCWKLETEPAVDLLQEPTHCQSPVPTEERWFRIDSPYATGATEDHDIVVVSVPEKVKSATVQFVDESEEAEPTFLDEENGLVVWAGKSRPFLGSMTITMPDGYEVACGPGDISNALQLSEEPEPKILETRRHPWTCAES
jgi:hypothetical protein